MLKNRNGGDQTVRVIEVFQAFKSKLWPTFQGTTINANNGQKLIT